MFQEWRKNPELIDRNMFVVCCAGTVVTSLFGCLISIFLESGKAIEAVCIVTAIVYAVLLAVTTFYNKIQLGKILFCVSLNEICIPALFLCSSGSNGIATCFMIMGLLFPGILLSNKADIIITAIAAATDVFLFVFENILEPVRVHEGNAVFSTYIAIAVFCVSTVLSIVIRSQIQLYRVQTERLRKSIEEEHEARQAAEEANVTKTQFLSNMSHEIRTPMNAIVGIANLLQEEKLTRTGEEYLATLQSSSQNLLQIIDDLLDYSRMIEGGISLNCKEYNIGDMYREIYQMMEFKVKDRPELALKKDFANDIPSGLIGDANRIRQVIINLLSNAEKFTDQGVVTFRTEWIAQSAEHGVLKISVIDTGRGIREAEKERIFNAFEQADAKVNRSKGGSGLGLAICKMLVDLMQGRIYVESTFGKGSSFVVEIPQTISNAIPIVLEEEKKPRAANIISFQAPRAKVLVVDDNKVNLKVASALLKRYNMEPVVANSGLEALNLLAKEKDFDIILMDYMMPEMDGIETTRLIHNKGIQIPVIALTANTVDGAENMYYDAGMVGYLPKPIDLSDLDEVLSKWIPAEKQKLVYKQST